MKKKTCIVLFYFVMVYTLSAMATLSLPPLRDSLMTMHGKTWHDEFACLG